MFSKAKKKLRLECKVCHAELERNRLEKTKRVYISNFGSGCVGCGYNLCVGGIDFHHLLRDEKRFEISDSSKGFAETAAELAKCVPLCRCCHRSAHGLADDGYALYAKFLQPAEKIFKSISGRDAEPEELKFEVLRKFCTCGVQISLKSKTCPSCSARKRHGSPEKKVSGTLKKCQWCEEELDESLFYEDRRNKTRYGICSECQKNRAKQSQRDGKKVLTYLFSNKCALCDRTKHSDMDFHHIDPTAKDFSIAAMKNCSVDQFIPELAKTIMICANHHAEVHAGQHNAVDLSQFLVSEDILRSRFNEISGEDSSKLDSNYCTKCTQELDIGAEFCSTCNSKSIFLVKRQLDENWVSKIPDSDRVCACGHQKHTSVSSAERAQRA